VSALIPELLTPGAANSLAVNVRRSSKTEPDATRLEVLKRILSNYQAPVAREVMDFQIALAASEASDLNFVPEIFRRK
jgi:hypothetical protein